MNGENLVYDYRFNVVDEPTDWAFNWDYAECGTSEPTAREHWATMWMVMNDDDPIWALKRLFKQLGRRFPMKLEIKEPNWDDEEDGDNKFEFTVVHKSQDIS
mmetsp:Transcript_22423/g.48607  ORF Transcript_22423/g.48607 Transcript_22423/m.48607 type:complete len:102 (-) Transcript_22423:573-878(-)